MAIPVQHDVRQLPNMVPYQAKPDSPSTYESLKLTNLGNKAIESWAKKVTLPRRKVQVYQVLMQDLLTASDRLAPDSPEASVFRRQVVQCLQGWGCPIERIKPKLQIQNLIRILCGCIALS